MCEMRIDQTKNLLRTYNEQAIHSMNLVAENTRKTKMNKNKVEEKFCAFVE